jgi:hypothetical protein
MTVQAATPDNADILAWPGEVSRLLRSSPLAWLVPKRHPGEDSETYDARVFQVAVLATICAGLDRIPDRELSAELVGLADTVDRHLVADLHEAVRLGRLSDGQFAEHLMSACRWPGMPTLTAQALAVLNPTHGDLLRRRAAQLGHADPTRRPIPKHVAVELDGREEDR